MCVLYVTRGYVKSRLAWHFYFTPRHLASLFLLINLPSRRKGALGVGGGAEHRLLPARLCVCVCAANADRLWCKEQARGKLEHMMIFFYVIRDVKTLFFSFAGRVL